MTRRPVQFLIPSHKLTKRFLWHFRTIMLFVTQPYATDVTERRTHRPVRDYVRKWRFPLILYAFYGYLQPCSVEAQWYLHSRGGPTKRFKRRYFRNGNPDAWQELSVFPSNPSSSLRIEPLTTATVKAAENHYSLEQQYSTDLFARVPQDKFSNPQRYWSIIRVIQVYNLHLK
jgi:hypothetical protein